MATYTKTCTPEEIQAIYKQYENEIIKETKPQYTHYQIKTDTMTITAYTSGKVVYQGKDLPQESAPATTQMPQAGSDEVGTGDYFGPVVVCAAIVTEEDLPLIQKLGIQDSKQLTDAHIRKIAPQLMKQCPHSILVVSNEKYNQVHDEHNMVDIKSKLHNQAYVNLQKKGYVLPAFKVVDQFAGSKTYYDYLKGEPDIIRDIHFETKAENKYPAVALASVLARYAFLKEWDLMEEAYDFSFPKGAGGNVDQAGAEFVKQYGKDALRKVAKYHFKNTEKLVID